jgi:hypothetical protein
VAARVREVGTRCARVQCPVSLDIFIDREVHEPRRSMIGDYKTSCRRNTDVYRQVGA